MYQTAHQNITPKHQWLTIVGVVLGVLLALLVLLIVFIQTEAGKNYVRKQVVIFLHKKLGTPLQIGSLDYHFPNSIQIQQVWLVDQQKDTLLKTESLLVALNMWQLISGKVNINSIELKNTQLHINRKATDSSFNFQYIINAFASKTTNNAPKQPLQITINTVLVNDFLLRYNDQLNKLFCNANVGHLNISTHAINLSTMQFLVKDIALQNSAVTITDKSTQQAKLVAATNTPSTPFNLAIDKVAVQKLLVRYNNTASKLNYYNWIDTLQVQAANLHLKNESFAAKSVTLNHSVFTLATNDARIVLKDTITHVIDMAIEQGWRIKLDTIRLNKNKVAIDNNAFAVAKEGLDYNHLKLDSVSLQSTNAFYHADTVTANILSGTVLANGVLVKNVKGAVFLNNKIAFVKGFLLNTPNSLVAADGNVVFNRTANNEMLNNASELHANIQKSYVGVNDLFFFFPSYKRNPPIALRPTDKIIFSGKADGTLQNVAIALLNVQTSNNQLQLIANGAVQNLLNTKALQYNVEVNRLYIDKRLLTHQMQQQLQQSKINLPANVLVNGKLAGTIETVNANLRISSPYGLANVVATATHFADVKKLQYNINLTAQHLQTGKWIYQDSLLGLFTGNMTLKGTGTDYKKAIVAATANIKSFAIKGYNYTHAAIKAQINKGIFSLVGNVNDENLITAININGNLSNPYPALKGHIMVEKANLQKLGYTTDSIQVRTNVLIDAPDLSPNKLNALLRFDSSTITYHGKHIFADSLVLKANAANDTTKLFVAAPFVQANMIGKYNYQKLPTTINAFIQHNYLHHNKDTAQVFLQQMVLHAIVTADATLKNLLPSLKMDVPATIYAAFDNSKRDTALVVAANIPSITYNGTEVKAMQLHANGVDSFFTFNLATDYVLVSKQKLYHAGAAGSFANSNWNVIAKTEDAKQQLFYAIGAAIKLENDRTTLHLSDSLLLNYAKWQVAPNNFIALYKDGYIINNFAINKGNQSVLIANQQPLVTAPIHFIVNNFNLGDVLTIANQDSTMAGGIINIDAVVQQPITSLPQIVGTAGIQQFTFKNVAIGDITAKATIGTDKIITVKGGINGANNVVAIDGGYNTNDNTFVLNTQIDKLNLQAIEAFSQGQIIMASGNVHGNVFANGAVSSPRWQGELVFDTTQFATAMYGSLYHINNQKVDFEYPNIGLYDFTVTDSLGNKLVLDGTLKQQPNNDFAIQMSINAKKFIAINQPRTPNAMVYGLGIVDAEMLISGTSATLDIGGNVTLDNKSDIHYTLPAKNNYKDDLKQVVKFIDIDTIKSFSNRNTIFTSAADTAATLKFAGLKYNLNLEVQEKANITVLIDPASGDELNIKGKAQLNTNVDENGIIGVTGVYQLKEGTYNLSYQFIKKQFNLVDGSTITFSGNPMEAIADITAIYEVETAPKELLGNEVSENSTVLGTAYNKKVPFDVVLKITGPITKPNLSFDIKVKDNAEGVNTTLGITIENKLAQYRNDVSEMNKQVFALLILGRFIGDRSSDFFATNNSGGTSTNDAVKQSVSKFLAEAVNHIAADLIKGVDINLDLKNYEGDAATNTTTRTDLNLQLSKQLLNDRLVVTVGKSFTIDGEDPLAKTQNNSNLQFLPDISTTYKLSKDGKYALKAYRKNQYEAILDGYFTETGMVFSFTMNYEKLQELLRKRNNKTKP